MHSQYTGSCIVQKPSKALNANDHPLAMKRRVPVTVGCGMFFHIKFGRVSEKRTWAEMSGVPACEIKMLGSTMHFLQLMELPEPFMNLNLLTDLQSHGNEGGERVA